MEIIPHAKAQFPIHAKDHIAELPVPLDPWVFAVEIPVYGKLPVDGLEVTVGTHEQIVGEQVAMQDPRLLQGNGQLTDIFREAVGLIPRQATREQLRQ